MRLKNMLEAIIRFLLNSPKMPSVDDYLNTLRSLKQPLSPQEMTDLKYAKADFKVVLASDYLRFIYVKTVVNSVIIETVEMSIVNKPGCLIVTFKDGQVIGVTKDKTDYPRSSVSSGVLMALANILKTVRKLVV